MWCAGSIAPSCTERAAAGGGERVVRLIPTRQLAVRPMRIRKPLPGNGLRLRPVPRTGCGAAVRLHLEGAARGWLGT